MAQATPNYGYATGKTEKPIVDALVNKYSATSVCWPIVLSSGGSTIAYLFERNKKNTINSQHDIRPKSTSGVKEYYLDYSSKPRLIDPNAPFLLPLVASEFESSYEFILAQQSGYSTVDLDYVWCAGVVFKGFELTTFFKDFHSEAEAKRLVSMMNRRPSWQGVNGAHALYKIAAAAQDLNIQYYLVCANTTGGVGSALNTSGNVLYFPLTSEQIDRLSAGQAPTNATFCTFQHFLNQL